MNYNKNFMKKNVLVFFGRAFYVSARSGPRPTLPFFCKIFVKRIYI